MIADLELSGRKGARRMADVPSYVLVELAAGRVETVNLMEWLAADMSALASTVATQVSDPALGAALVEAGREMAGTGVTRRLKIAGGAIAANAPPGSANFFSLAAHKSDLVRQWACYAVNDSSLSRSLDQRLQETLLFAADRNMSVREVAWMAYRPHLAEHFEQAFPLIERLAKDPDDRIRRFAVEVARPRSVWGSHLSELKYNPGRAIKLLEQVRADPSHYVRLAVGNWLNDASKTRPDWVLELSRRWNRVGDRHTSYIIKRGLRTVVAREHRTSGEPVLPFSRPHISDLEPMENELC